MPASRLIPVISIIVYFGHEKWTAARSLYDMMPNLPDELKAVIPNFWINLIHYEQDNDMTNEQEPITWHVLDKMPMGNISSSAKRRSMSNHTTQLIFPSPGQRVQFVLG